MNRTQIRQKLLAALLVPVLTVAFATTLGAHTSTTAKVVLAIISVLVTFVAATVAAHSLELPLVRLADQARALASEGLPLAVEAALAPPGPGGATDSDQTGRAKVSRSKIAEIDAVAEALNSVSDAAVALASEQAGLQRNIAESLLSMGRRVHTLVTNQLEIITEMGQTELPDGTRCDLRRLGHLVTRVRRNAESLIVLASQPSEPVTTYGKPVVLLDLVRAAVAEVHEHDRVDLDLSDLDCVAGSAAAPLTHILAELTDNGLLFSPPQTRVVISGTMFDDGYVIEVSDQGIGMPPEALAEANLRLRSDVAFTASPSKYLGHLVTGALSKRIGVEVVLTGNNSGGVTAMVALPLSMLRVAGSLDDVAAPRRASGRPAGSGGPMSRKHRALVPEPVDQPSANSIFTDPPDGDPVTDAIDADARSGSDTDFEAGGLGEGAPPGDGGLVSVVTGGSSEQ